MFLLLREDSDGVVSPDVFGRAGAPKDVVYLGPSETLWVVARFGPHKGEYMMVSHTSCFIKSQLHIFSPSQYHDTT